MNPRRPTPSGPEPHAKLGSGTIPVPVLKHDDGGRLEPSASKLADFKQWCLQHASREQCDGYVRYLMKPLDTSNRWSVTAWKRYYRWLCEEKGVEEACVLFKKVRSRKGGTDLYVPSLEEVLETVSRAEHPYSVVYSVLLQSGLRLREACYLLRNIGRLKTISVDGFTRVELGLSRRSKRAFWAYLLEPPPRILVTDKEVSDYSRHNGLLAPKYFRKFVAQRLYELGCRADTIDFIQGRTPSRILTKHYIELLHSADKCYEKYAEWLRENIPLGEILEERGLL